MEDDNACLDEFIRPVDVCVWDFGEASEHAINGWVHALPVVGSLK